MDYLLRIIHTNALHFSGFISVLASERLIRVKSQMQLYFCLNVSKKNSIGDKKPNFFLGLLFNLY
jgi:hypothetical protein